MENFELRMYFFVPYNISTIQQGIQCGHAALEYARKYSDDQQFIEFADNYKTWIILNGGTTNKKRDENGVSLGTLDQIADNLLDNGIKHSFFHEPDLNNALTSVCFICDERVWNYKDYPDFYDYIINKHNITSSFERIKIMTTPIEDPIFNESYTSYETWLNDVIGGKKNIFLRELIKNKKLA
jgi:hypothetical protein